MTNLTNLTAVVTSLIVTSYTTNVVSTDNGTYKDCDTGWVHPSIPPQAITDRHTITPPTERYEQITITEHKVAEVTLTNGIVLRQELTNRVVSDRIRTWKLIQVEEFVGEKDAPKTTRFLYFNGRPITLTEDNEGSFLKINPTNVVEWQIHVGTNIVANPPPWGDTFTPNNDTEKP